MVKMPHNERKARIRALRVAGLCVRNAEWSANMLSRGGVATDPMCELAWSVGWLLLALGEDRPTLPKRKRFVMGLP